MAEFSGEGAGDLEFHKLVKCLAGEYAGKFVFIIADENVYATFIEVCQLYETGGLVNLDTN